MNKLNIYGFIVMIVAIALIAFTQPVTLATPPSQDNHDLGFPEDVMTVLETSCFDCHIADSKNIKAKSQLNFSKWNDLKDRKKIGKLDEICEEVKENEMPPEKYLKNNPDKALSEEQVELICKWVDEEVEKLLDSE
jgi:hypothetical protein